MSMTRIFQSETSRLFSSASLRFFSAFSRAPSPLLAPHVAAPLAKVERGSDLVSGSYEGEKSLCARTVTFSPLIRKATVGADACAGQVRRACARGLSDTVAVNV